MESKVVHFNPKAMGTPKTQKQLRIHQMMPSATSGYFTVSPSAKNPPQMQPIDPKLSGFQNYQLSEHLVFRNYPFPGLWLKPQKTDKDRHIAPQMFVDSTEVSEVVEFPVLTSGERPGY
ncbi:hypothetical protein STEG23_027543 [Scotinomys teguina]